MTEVHSATVETPLAFLGRLAEDMVEVRFKTGAHLTVAGMIEMIRNLDAHGMAMPRRVLVVFPETPVEIDLRAIITDHLSRRPSVPGGRTIAMVAGNSLNARLAKLYFTYFPGDVRFSVFQSRAEALGWLHGST